jgi:L-ribulose-5-phosphate 3-epimerase
MNNHQFINRLAVCSWSLQPTSPQDLVTKLESTGVRRLQLALDPLRENPGVWGSAFDLFAKNGITIASGMFGCLGEDYATLDSIRRTGGIAPDATWEENRKNIQASAVLAQKLGLRLVTFHAGFLPHDSSDPAFARMIGRLVEVADFFAAGNMTLGLETGQETAQDLLQVLKAVDRRNLAVNFDPGNMILYDKGDPIEALRSLGSWVRQVHIKDATRTKVPGTWGEEVTAGTGQVHWRAFFSVLQDLKFTGDIIIEREAGQDRVGDIRKARALLESIAG